MAKLKKLLVVFFVICLMTIKALCDVSTTEINVAEKIAKYLGTNDFDSVRGYFNENLKAALSADQMQRAWNQLVAQVGEFDHVVKATPTSTQGGDVVDVLCATKQAGMIVRVTFDNAGSVAGLWISPTAPPANTGPSGSSAENPPAANGDESHVAEKIAKYLGANDFDSVRGYFNENLKAALSSDQMQHAWNQLVAQVGDFDHVVKSTSNSAQGGNVVDVLCATKQAGMTVRVTFDNSGAVAGLWISPAP